MMFRCFRGDLAGRLWTGVQEIDGRASNSKRLQEGRGQAGFAFERMNHHWVFLVIGDIWGPFITSQRTCDLEEEMHITRWVTRKQVHLDF